MNVKQLWRGGSGEPGAADDKDEEKCVQTNVYAHKHQHRHMWESWTRRRRRTHKHPHENSHINTNTDLHGETGHGGVRAVLLAVGVVGEGRGEVEFAVAVLPGGPQLVHVRVVQHEDGIEGRAHHPHGTADLWCYVCMCVCVCVSWEHLHCR